MVTKQTTESTEKQLKPREIILDEPMNILVNLAATGALKDSSGELLGQTLTCFVLATNTFHGIAPWDKGDEHGNPPRAQWYDNLLIVPTQGKHNDLFDMVSDRTVCAITRDKYHMAPFFDATKKIRADEELEDMADALNEELGFSPIHPLRIQPWNLCPWVLSFKGKSNKHGNYAAMSWALVTQLTPRQQETQLKVVRFYQEHFKQATRPDGLNLEIGEMTNLTYLESAQKRAYKQLVGSQNAATSLNQLTANEVTTIEAVAS